MWGKQASKPLTACELKVENPTRDGIVKRVWINDAKASLDILIDKGKIWGKGNSTIWPFQSIVPLHIISLPEGPTHSAMREAAMVTLSQQRERATTVALEHAHRLCWDLEASAGQPVRNLDTLIRDAALGIISDLLFGGKDMFFGNGKVDALKALMLILHERITNSSDRDWLRLQPGKGAAEAPRAKLLPFIREQIDLKKQAPDGSFLSTWLEEFKHLTAEEIENLCLTFLTMGHENISSAISHTLLQLAENKSAQDYVAAQVIASGVGTTLPDQFSFSKLNKLTRTEEAFLEASRLFPSVAVVTRQSTHDTIVSGYIIPAGTEVLVSLHKLNRPSPDVDEFVCPRNTFVAWYSFGGGARKCPGSSLSSIESKAIVGVLLARFSVTSTLGRPVRPQNLVSFRPGHHQVVFKPRSITSSL